MKIPKGARIEKACSNESRPTISQPYLDVERGTLEATNTYLAVRLPVEVAEDDTSGAIPLRAIKTAREEKAADISCNGGIAIPGVGTFERPEVLPPEVLPPGTKDAARFPDLNVVFASAEDPAGGRMVSIGLNPTFLLAIMQALGDPKGSVRIDFAVDESGQARPRAMKVTPLSGNGEAVLMPVRLAS